MASTDIRTEQHHSPQQPFVLEDSDSRLGKRRHWRGNAAFRNGIAAIPSPGRYARKASQCRGTHPALAPAFAAEGAPKLFSVVTEKDKTVVALTKEDISLGDDAAAIGNALRQRGSLTVWRYAVRKARDGELEQAPLAKISVPAAGTLRVQPYRTPPRVVPVE